MSRPATADDVHEICMALPEVEALVAEIDRDELAEIIAEAWAARAPKTLVRTFFGDD